MAALTTSDHFAEGLTSETYSDIAFSESLARCLILDIVYDGTIINY